MSEKKKFDLEERLVEFSIKIIEIVESLPDSKVANHLGGQLLRSGTSPALNYAEAESAESMNDFIHKMKICLKELRETFVALRIVNKKYKLEPEGILNYAINENNELISIFVKSISTAQNKK